MGSFHHLPQDTRVTFKLQNRLPIFREHYTSAQAGTVILKGFFHQTAHIELLDGSRFRLANPRRDDEYPDHLAYPLIRLPERTEVCRLRTPLRLEGSTPRLRYTTVLENTRYVFRQISAGKRGFELWDSIEMTRLVERIPGSVLLSELIIHAPVPAVLVLLFPWLDSQLMSPRTSR